MAGFVVGYSGGYQKLEGQIGCSPSPGSGSPDWGKIAILGGLGLLGYWLWKQGKEGAGGGRFQGLGGSATIDLKTWIDNFPFDPPSNRTGRISELELVILKEAKSKSVRYWDKWDDLRVGDKLNNEQIRFLNEIWSYYRYNPPEPLINYPHLVEKYTKLVPPPPSKIPPELEPLAKVARKHPEFYYSGFDALVKEFQKIKGVRTPLEAATHLSEYLAEWGYGRGDWRKSIEDFYNQATKGVKRGAK